MKISKRVFNNISNIVAFVFFLQILAIMAAFFVTFTQYKYLVDIVNDVINVNNSYGIEICIEETQNGGRCHHERY